MRGKAVTESMNGDVFMDSALFGSLFEMLLEDRGVKVMATKDVASRVTGQGLGWKKPLPGPLFAGIWKFSLNGTGEENTGNSIFSITVI